MSALPNPAPALFDLSDDDLQTTIVQLGDLMLAAEHRYQRDNLIADKGDRDRYWNDQRLALEERARRPHLVAAMETRRGLV